MSDNDMLDAVAGGDKTVLAATMHDGGGTFLPLLERLADPLRQLFSGFAIVATESTASVSTEFLSDQLGAHVRHVPPNGNIGEHRRQSVSMALANSPDLILYSDLDNILRWVDADRAEVESTLRPEQAEFTVIGRTDKAMRACPARLRDTENIVNHIYRLVTGRSWDLMFAVRAMTPRAAEIIVGECSENSIANDVEWPLVVERHGVGVGYREADGLSYRTGPDIESAADTYDADPMKWIQRIEIANLHAQAFKRVLTAV